MRTSLMLSAVLLVVWGTEAHAGFIDFENGYTDLQTVPGAIDTGDNLLTISTTGPAANPSGLSCIAGVGLPRTAFTTSKNPNLESDEAVDGRAGSFFLTDENTPDVNQYASDYTFSFAEGITELSMDIFDFRVDGGAQGTSEASFDSATAILTLFADEAMTLIVGMTSFTAFLENQPIDGNWQKLLVTADGVAVKAVLDLGQLDRGVGVDNISFVTEPPPVNVAVKAVLDLGQLDRGVGVDNTSFVTEPPPVNPVPEPSSFVLLSMGVAGLFGFRRMKQRKAA